VAGLVLSAQGDPKKGFEWTYHFFWGFDMVSNMFADMWLSLPTNKTVGTMFSNDPDGVAANDEQHGLPATFKSNGFNVRNLGLYPPLSDDFTAQIAEFKKANCEIVCGIFNRRNSRPSGRSARSRATGPRS